LPGHIFDARDDVCAAGKGEEQIAEAIEVHDEIVASGRSTT